MLGPPEEDPPAASLASEWGCCEAVGTAEERDRTLGLEPSAAAAGVTARPGLANRMPRAPLPFQAPHCQMVAKLQLLGELGIVA